MNKRRIPITTIIFLCIGGIAMVFPFLWMFSTSLKSGVDIYNISLIPKRTTLEAYKYVIENTKFLTWFKNSFIIASITTISVLFFDTLVGYAFAKLEFKGKNALFLIILSTLMVPTEMLIIPWYMMVNELGWFNSYWSLLFPGLSSAFGIFLMKQFFEGVPNDLLEAARIDGLSEFGIFWRAAVPLVKPAISALAIFTFLGNWNAFLWPVIAVDSPDIYTLPVGLALFSGEAYNQWNLVMAGATIATIPILIVFFIFQKRIIDGIHLTGLKG
ncbi:carbohydrate ABC transporter permease [Clostridium malenominatum]|uniref:Carbohydrate ABC transporter permease n=1 Tax=Clostridium malenominatum TaxID=1539 RepID=A0ABP3U7U8_9CLOT